MSDRSEADFVSNDLVERVARNICCMNGQCYRPEKCFSWTFSGEARAAIAVCMEEAARVAKGMWWQGHGNLATEPYSAAKQAGDEIAAAIRALVKDLSSD